MIVQSSTNLVADNERPRHLAVHNDCSTGVAIRRDVGIRDGQVRDGTNGGSGEVDEGKPESDVGREIEELAHNEPTKVENG